MGRKRKTRPSRQTEYDQIITGKPKQKKRRLRKLKKSDNKEGKNFNGFFLIK